MVGVISIVMLNNKIIRKKIVMYNIYILCVSENILRNMIIVIWVIQNA